MKHKIASQRPAVLHAALVIMAVLALCSVGRCQSPPAPSVSVVYPESGMTLSVKYVDVRVSAAGFSKIASVLVTMTNASGGSFGFVGRPTGFQGYDGGKIYEARCATLPLIPHGATYYNGGAKFVATVSGIRAGSPVVQAVVSAAMTDTVQIGYTLGAVGLNTATMMAPTNAVTLHLDKISTPFVVCSKYRFDFFRYDSFGAYAPVVNIQLQSTFPSASGYTTIKDETHAFKLPLQPGDVSVEYSLTHEGTLSSSRTGTKIQFNDRAMSFYPVGSQVSADTASATVVLP